MNTDFAVRLRKLKEQTMTSLVSQENTFTSYPSIMKTSLLDRSIVVRT